MNVLDLLTGKGLKAQKVGTSSGRGVEWASPCPGCGGEDRFHVWPEQNNGDGSWWCRGCGQGGDNIDFLRRFDGMSFKDACFHVGRDLPHGYGGKGGGTGNTFMRLPIEPLAERVWAPKTTETPAELWRRKAQDFVDSCHAALLADPEQLAYLAGRGITRASVTAHRLGWHQGETDKGTFRDRVGWGLPKLLKENGKRKMLWFPKGIVIPQIIDGEVHRLRIRRPDTPKNKYFVIPGSSMAPMVFPGDGKAFLVEEAELDGILLHQEVGDLVTVAALGGTTIRPDDLMDARLKAALHIMVCMDHERNAKGESPGAKAAAWWVKHYPKADTWPVPVGKDPGEAFEAGVDLRAWVLAGLPPLWRVGYSQRLVDDGYESEEPQAEEEPPAPLPPASDEPPEAPAWTAYPEIVELVDFMTVWAEEGRAGIDLIMENGQIVMKANPPGGRWTDDFFELFGEFRRLVTRASSTMYRLIELGQMRLRRVSRV